MWTHKISKMFPSEMGFNDKLQTYKHLRQTVDFGEEMRIMFACFILNICLLSTWIKDRQNANCFKHLEYTYRIHLENSSKSLNNAKS